MVHSNKVLLLKAAGVSQARIEAVEAAHRAAFQVYLNARRQEIAIKYRHVSNECAAACSSSNYGAI